jgi:hypothetical protein
MNNLETLQPDTIAVLAKGTDLTPTSLAFTDVFGASEWLDYMGVLFAFASSQNWWIGDALSQGEAMLGEDYAQAEAVAERYGINRERLRNCQWVSERVAPVTRVTGLSWSSHRAVGGLGHVEQRKILAEAIAEGLDHRQVAKRVKALENGEVTEPERCPTCGRIMR